MPHSNTWDDTPLVIGDQAGEGYANINTTHTDVSERMQLEHAWDGGVPGETTDGVHKPGFSSVVENQTNAEDLATNHETALTGSIAFTRDTETLYVKVGTEQSANGTWTAVHQDFGAWDTTKVQDTSYEATIAGFCVATLTVTTGTTTQMVGRSDGSDPPVTIRARTFASYGGTGDDNVQDASICFPVVKGDYYEVEVNNQVGSGSTVVVYFLPLTLV